MNECERLGTPFTENYEYYTDYSATPDSTIGAGYTNVDQTNTMETATPRDANGTDATIEPKANDEITACAKEADPKLTQYPVENPSSALTSARSSPSPAKEKATKKSNSKVIAAHASKLHFHAFIFTFHLLLSSFICRTVIRMPSKSVESEKI